MPQEFIGGMVAAVMATLISLTAVVLMVMLIIKAVGHKQKLHHEALMAMIERGVCDPALLTAKRQGYAVLGWGMALIGIGAAVLIGLITLGSAEGLMGGLIPLFVGVALVITHSVVRKSRAEAERNTTPPALHIGGAKIGRVGIARDSTEENTEGRA